MAALCSIQVLHLLIIILIRLSFSMVSGYTTNRKPIEIGSDGGYDFLLALDENLEEDDQLLKSVKVYFNIFVKKGFKDMCHMSIIMVYNIITTFSGL